ncbi:hypothetical protein P7K49_009136, partial [Saguinus oedipus]
CSSLSTFQPHRGDIRHQPAGAAGLGSLPRILGWLITSPKRGNLSRTPLARSSKHSKTNPP